MEKKKSIKLGILGLGIVGTELVLQILKNIQRIAVETSVTIEIEKIYVRSLTKTRTISNITTLPLTTNISEVIDNPVIDVICDCMGGNGIDDTRKFLIRAMKNKKHVIMSSKKALATYAEELLTEAKKNNVYFKYDASVGGGIPIAKVLDSAFKGEKVVKVMGIFNATSNFIYTQMFNEKAEYENALKLAQDKGYAENDPSDDVDGIDSTNKLIILSLYAMGKLIHPSSLIPESFSRINIKDMNYASELGYKIKPIALIQLSGNNVEYKIGPCLVNAEHIVASTFSNFNIIIIEGEHCGELGFYGQGAGAKPTAAAMFDDLVNIVSSTKIDQINYEMVSNEQITDYQSKLYWRLTVKNQIGVLSRISTILAENEVNIEKIIQKDELDNGIEIVLLTSNVSNEKKKELERNFSLSDVLVNSVIPFV